MGDAENLADKVAALEQEVAKLKSGEGWQACRDYFSELLDEKLKIIKESVENAKREVLAEILLLKDYSPQKKAPPQEAPCEQLDNKAVESPLGEGVFEDVKEESNIDGAPEEQVEYNWNELTEWPLDNVRKAAHLGGTKAALIREGNSLELLSGCRVLASYSVLKGIDLGNVYSTGGCFVVEVKGGLALFRLLEDKLDWMYGLFWRGPTWRRVGRIADVPTINNKPKYCVEFGTVLALTHSNWVAAWSIDQEKTVFLKKVPEAFFATRTFEHILVAKKAEILLFDMTGTLAYSIPFKDGKPDSVSTLSSQCLTGVFIEKEDLVRQGSFFIPKKTTKLCTVLKEGNLVLAIEAVQFLLHPTLPWVCTIENLSSTANDAQSKALVLRDCAKEVSVLWKYPFDSVSPIISIDEDYFLLQGSEARVICWKSCNFHADLHLEGTLQVASPRFILTTKSVYLPKRVVKS